MLIYKCDSCKKEIDSHEKIVTAGFGRAFSSSTLCASCGAPVIRLLKKKKLLDVEVAARFFQESENKKSNFPLIPKDLIGP